ncbi:putative F-box/LRR-repeat protein 22 [Bidens hawaiensis]|uniref:putative F-box/LRR-repeat protein 22 n=1 Tax=Bidens hawaiensis TaxID=980011 RepID=UPI00404AFEFD
MRWSEAFKKISLLEKLSIVDTEISQKDIEAAGRYCPLLKTLKLNQNFGYRDDSDDEESTWNDIALAIVKNLPELTHRPFWMVVVILNLLTFVGVSMLNYKETWGKDVHNRLNNQCVERDDGSFNYYRAYDELANSFESLVTMASKSKLKCEQPTRNWSELPSDLTINILQRLGVVDRLENAQKVCTAWRKT